MAAAQLLVKLSQPIKRERGYMYYIAGNQKGDGMIVGIFKKPMRWNKEAK